MKKHNRYEPPLLRRAIYGGVAGAIGSVLVQVFGVPRILVAIFRDSAPWILPTIVVGCVGVFVLTLLLLPLAFRKKSPNNAEA